MIKALSAGGVVQKREGNYWIISVRL